MKLLILLILFTNILFANVGKIVSLKGEANITRDNKTFQVKRDTLLKEKDLLITKNNSKVQILFKDETIISIGKNSTFKINDYLFEDKDNVKAEFSMIKGVFRTITGKIGKIAPQNFKLKTKSASIGIRGTQIITQITDGKERIFCTEGQIEVTQISTNLKIIVNKGEFIAMERANGNSLQKNKTKIKDLKEVNQNVSVNKNKAQDSVTKEETVGQEDSSTLNTQTNTTQTVETENVVKVVADSESNDEVLEKVNEEAEAKRLADEKAEAQRVADEKLAAKKEAQRLADEEAQRLDNKRIAQEEAQRLADEEAQRLAQEQVAAAEAQRLADEEAQRLAQEQVAAAEAQRLADEEAQRLADENASEQEKADAAEVQRLANEEAQKLADEQVAAAEAQRLANEEAQRLADEQAVAEEAQRLADQEALQLAADQAAAEEAQRLVDEEAAAELTASLQFLTPDSYYVNNNSKASYVGNFNSTPFDSKRQYLEIKEDKNKVSIPMNSTISMNIDFGAADDQVSNGKVSVIGYTDLKFDGHFHKDNKLHLRPIDTTSGKGGDAYFYGAEGNIIKGDIDLHNDDIKIKADFQASKYNENSLNELTELDYFTNNTSTATYSGDFNSYTYDEDTQFKKLGSYKYKIPDETSINMNIDFGATSNQITEGKIDHKFTSDLNFNGSISGNSFELTGIENTTGTGSGNFYGTSANVIRGEVDMTDSDEIQTKGKFEASKN